MVGPTTSVSAAVAYGLGATNRIKGPTNRIKGATTIPSPTSGFLSSHKTTLRDVFIFGGKASVTSAQQTAINNALKP